MGLYVALLAVMSTLGPGCLAEPMEVGDSSHANSVPTGEHVLVREVEKGESRFLEVLVPVFEEPWELDAPSMDKVTTVTEKNGWEFNAVVEWGVCRRAQYYQDFEVTEEATALIQTYVVYVVDTVLQDWYTFVDELFVLVNGSVALPPLTPSQSGEGELLTIIAASGGKAGTVAYSIMTFGITLGMFTGVFEKAGLIPNEIISTDVRNAIVGYEYSEPSKEELGEPYSKFLGDPFPCRYDRERGGWVPVEAEKPRR